MASAGRKENNKKEIIKCKYDCRKSIKLNINAFRNIEKPKKVTIINTQTAGDLLCDCPESFKKPPPLSTPTEIPIRKKETITNLDNFTCDCPESFQKPPTPTKSQDQQKEIYLDNFTCDCPESFQKPPTPTKSQDQQKEIYLDNFTCDCPKSFQRPPTPTKSQDQQKDIYLDDFSCDCPEYFKKPPEEKIFPHYTQTGSITNWDNFTCDCPKSFQKPPSQEVKKVSSVIKKSNDFLCDCPEFFKKAPKLKKIKSHKKIRRINKDNVLCDCPESFKKPPPPPPPSSKELQELNNREILLCDCPEFFKEAPTSEEIEKQKKISKSVDDMTCDCPESFKKEPEEMETKKRKIESASRLENILCDCTEPDARPPLETLFISEKYKEIPKLDAQCPDSFQKSPSEEFTEIDKPKICDEICHIMSNVHKKLKKSQDVKETDKYIIQIKLGKKRKETTDKKMLSKQDEDEKESNDERSLPNILETIDKKYEKRKNLIKQLKNIAAVLDTKIKLKQIIKCIEECLATDTESHGKMIVQELEDTYKNLETQTNDMYTFMGEESTTKSKDETKSKMRDELLSTLITIEKILNKVSEQSLTKIFEESCLTSLKTVSSIRAMKLDITRIKDKLAAEGTVQEEPEKRIQIKEIEEVGAKKRKSKKPYLYESSNASTPRKKKTPKLLPSISKKLAKGRKKLTLLQSSTISEDLPKISTLKFRRKTSKKRKKKSKKSPRKFGTSYEHTHSFRLTESEELEERKRLERERRLDWLKQRYEEPMKEDEISVKELKIEEQKLTGARPVWSISDVFSDIYGKGKEDEEEESEEMREDKEWKSESMQKAEYYCKSRHIADLFQYLGAYLISTGPENPIDFLIDLLDQCYNYRNGEQDPPLLFDIKHIESLYDSMDPMHTGFITLEQYYTGMYTLGIRNFKYTPRVSDNLMIRKKTFINDTFYKLKEQLDKMLALPYTTPYIKSALCTPSTDA